MSKEKQAFLELWNDPLPVGVVLSFHVFYLVPVDEKFAEATEDLLLSNMPTGLTDEVRPTLGELSLRNTASRLSCPDLDPDERHFEHAGIFTIKTLENDDLSSLIGSMVSVLKTDEGSEGLPRPILAGDVLIIATDTEAIAGVAVYNRHSYSLDIAAIEREHLEWQDYYPESERVTFFDRYLSRRYDPHT